MTGFYIAKSKILPLNGPYTLEYSNKETEKYHGTYYGKEHLIAIYKYDNEYYQVIVIQEKQYGLRIFSMTHLNRYFEIIKRCEFNLP